MLLTIVVTPSRADIELRAPVFSRVGIEIELFRERFGDYQKSSRQQRPLVEFRRSFGEIPSSTSSKRASIGSSESSAISRIS